MSETGKYFYLPPGVLIGEPEIYGLAYSAAKSYPDKLLLPGDIDGLNQQFAADMEEMAPDLKSYGLAKHFADTLFTKFKDGNVQTLAQIITAGAGELHQIGKYVLGPLAVSFVDTALKDCYGKAIFPARDATPFFYIAKTLKALQPDVYPVKPEDIINPVFNRKLWGIEDEQDSQNEVLAVTHPLVQKLLSQMGFFSDQSKSFIEVGCWGSMIDQLNIAMEKGYMPREDFSVYFLYTHLPDKIYGFTNTSGAAIPADVLETIADTWEAFPKFFKRPTKLIEENGIVKASLKGKLIDSAFLPVWSQAALQGVVEAASDFVMQGQVINPFDELLKLRQLSLKAQKGEFTGVLPGHTQTWTEGDSWIKNWRWGKIAPLK